ncbi:restriction endonuclease [Aquibaculum arenosum]|uniref:Restriction endonuclease n=1 Tax=Aquibaculum arenosum TaxID=3032591 RepID=A0ABT5YID6_9PROT|nr:restriction endonuclease [Fodinicurvata sp. CAU 1616]MDF2094601.1 restriction endonuclease [Fodinicurvata sp. CAU 1616]
MAIPDYQALMAPVLDVARDGEIKVSQAVERLAETLGLSDTDRQALLPSGKQTVFANRVHWAKTYLKQAGLVEATRHGHFRTTERGQQALCEAGGRIDNSYLERFAAFRAFKAGAAAFENGDDAPEVSITTPAQDDERTPDEIMRDAHRRIERELRHDLLDRIIEAPPSLFERLVVALLIAMGYGGSAEATGRALGRSGDGGVDGVIDQDSLGLDRIYVQAKRYGTGNPVGAGAIRDFFGSLDRFKAAKGVFVTTSTFTREAHATADSLSKRIVLLDGNALAGLMVRHGVGCRTEEVLHLKRVDEDFFLD